jgi:hypothetical protein
MQTDTETDGKKDKGERDSDRETKGHRNRETQGQGINDRLKETER